MCGIFCMLFADQVQANKFVSNKTRGVVDVQLIKTKFIFLAF